MFFSCTDIDETVDQIIVELDLQDRCSLANLSDEGIEKIQLVLEHYLQQRLGGDWHEMLNDSSLDAVQPPAIIVRKVWERLKRTYRIRAVK